MENDFEIYKNRTFSSLIQSVVESTEKRRDQVTALIEDLRVLIKGPGDIAIIVPFIKEYLSVGTDNDENLTKLAGVLIRLTVASTAVEGDPSFLSPEERNQLMKDVKFTIDEIKHEDSTSDNKIKDINKKLKDVLG